MGPLIPQSVCDRAKLLSSIHPEHTVMMLTGLASGTLYRIKKRGWQAIQPGFRHRRRPGDFAIQAKYLTSHQLAAHYHASNQTIARWKRELRGAGR